MNALSDHATQRPLEVLGIGADEERAYRELLVSGASSAAHMAEKLGLPLRKAQKLLEALERMGLSTHSPERPRRYIPAAPDMALQALAIRHHQALQRTQPAIAELQNLAATAHREKSEQMIEVITSLDVGKSFLRQINASAQREISVLVRPPVLFAPSDLAREENPDQAEIRTRGVRCRSIVEADVLPMPGVLARIRADVRSGEEARVMPSLPFKMVLVDRRVGWLFLNTGMADTQQMLVRGSGLLDGLYTLFDILWERAVPITFSSSGEMLTGESAGRFTAETRELAELMAMGLNDKTIAHNLSISLRTLERRVADLLHALDARTRYQAGWVAASQLPAADDSRKPRSRPRVARSKSR